MPSPPEATRMPAPLHSPAPASRKILVRGVNWLGDAVMSMPALERLREACPNDHITLLTRDSTAGLWQNHPAVNQVIRFSKTESIFSLARRLRGEQFDVALILPNSHRSALESFLARIPERIGHARPWRNLFLTRAIPPRPEAVLIYPRSIKRVRALLAGPALRSKPPGQQSHHIYDYLHLAQALGAKPIPSAPRIPISPEELRRAEDLLVPQALTTGWLALNAGAEYGPAKRWPAERFVETALEVHRQTGCGWVLLGGPGDAPTRGPVGAFHPQAIRRPARQPRRQNNLARTLRRLPSLSSRAYQ